MRVPFFRLPVVSNRLDMPIIPTEDIEELVDYEPTAWAHWTFDSGEGSLSDRVNQRELTPISNAPTFQSNYITIPNASSSGLYTGFEDVEAAKDTLFGVFRLPATTNLIPFMGGYSSAGRGGMTYATSGTTALRNLTLTFSGTTIANRNTSMGVPTEVWVFVATSRDFSGATKRVSCLLGGEEGYEGTGTGTYLPRVSPTTPNNQLVLGRDDYSAGAGGNLDCAEFGIFDRVLSLTELQSLYARRKAALAEKGITVL